MPDASPQPPQPPLRERILAAAIQLFADRGYGAASVREVAERAGCTKPSLYYHFGAKEALFVAALREETDRLTRLVEAPFDPGGSVRAHLVRSLDRFFHHVRTDATGVRFVMRADLHPEPGQPSFDFASVREGHLGRTRELLDLARARGEIRADVRIDDAVFALTGLVDQRLHAWLQGHPLAADLPERLVSLFFHGVAP